MPQRGSSQYPKHPLSGSSNEHSEIRPREEVNRFDRSHSAPMTRDLRSHTCGPIVSFLEGFSLEVPGSSKRPVLLSAGRHPEYPEAISTQVMEASDNVA
jgi:hypothetical protein